MLSSQAIIFGMLYLVVAAGNIIGNYRESKSIIWITKPLLMPILLLMILFSSEKVHAWLLYGALTFGFFGDVFLLINSQKGNKWFILGMTSFMAGHICYFTWFLTFSQPLRIDIPLVVGLFICIAITRWFWKTVHASQHHHTWPICFYCLMIDLIVLGALLTWGHGPLLGTLLCLTGAILFGFSDFLIAMRVIGEPLDDNAMVMLTYTLAQFLLICGILVVSM